MIIKQNCFRPSLFVLISCLFSSASICFDAGPLEPSAAEHAMAVHSGWSATIVAHEPLVIDPVAIRFDRNRRLWVVESWEESWESWGEGGGALGRRAEESWGHRSFS